MIRFTELAEQFQIKKTINEYKTGSGKMDLGKEPNFDDQIGKFIGSMLETHEQSGAKASTHPLYDAQALNALKNIFIANKLSGHPEHGIHSKKETYEKNKKIIRERYPHLLHQIEAIEKPKY